MTLYGSDDYEESSDRATDEINSLASEDLYTSRPNRWSGAASTWRTFTEEDRQTYAALAALRDKDLSAHLYNAFALRRPGLLGIDRLPNSGVC